MPATDVNLPRLATIVQHDLIGMEDGDDQQLVQAARLLSTLCEARLEAQLPAQLSNPAIQSAIDAIRARGDARSASVKLHRQLGALAKVLSVEVAEGGYPKTVPMVAHPAAAALAEPALR